MPNQTIPITLQWGAGTPAQQAVISNEAGMIIAALLAAQIRADVSFFLVVVNLPTTYQTALILNSSNGLLYTWSITQGKYVPITPYRIGQISNDFQGDDLVSTGWVVLDGRAIADVPGLSASQQTALETLFGVGGSLPTVVPQNISGLPANGSFSGISITNPPTQAEVEAVRDVAESELQALNNNTNPPMYALVFCGFP